MTYPEAVRYLLSLLGDIRTANFGLARMERLVALLGEPDRTFRSRLPPSGSIATYWIVSTTAVPGRRCSMNSECYVGDSSWP